MDLEGQQVKRGAGEGKNSLTKRRQFESGPADDSKMWLSASRGRKAGGGGRAEIRKVLEDQALSKAREQKISNCKGGRKEFLDTSPFSVMASLSETKAGGPLIFLWGNS